MSAYKTIHRELSTLVGKLSREASEQIQKNLEEAKKHERDSIEYSDLLYRNLEIIGAQWAYKNVHQILDNYFELDYDNYLDGKPL